MLDSPPKVGEANMDKLQDGREQPLG